MKSDDLVFRLRKRAGIRRQISTRKSVQNNEPDRIADLLEEAAATIENQQVAINYWMGRAGVIASETLLDRREWVDED
jgi:hypothetical protein